MNESDLIIWKIDKSKLLRRVSLDSILSHITLEDIIIIYRYTKKRLYVWIGNKTTLVIENIVSQINEEFLKNYPELKILRRIIIRSGFEPPEFFKVIGISREKLKDQIEKQKPKIEGEDVITSEKSDISIIETEELQEGIEIEKIKLEIESFEEIKDEEEITLEKSETTIAKTEKVEDVTEIDEEDLKSKQLEEIINNINSLIKDCLEAQDKSDLTEILRKNKKIIDSLEDYIG